MLSVSTNFFSKVGNLSRGSSQKFLILRSSEEKTTLLLHVSMLALAHTGVSGKPCFFIPCQKALSFRSLFFFGGDFLGSF